MFSAGNAAPLLPGMGGRIARLNAYDMRTVLTSDLPLSQVKDGSVAIGKRNTTETEAKAIVQREVSKNTALEYSYHVGRTKRSKTIRPIKEDAQVTKVKHRGEEPIILVAPRMLLLVGCPVRRNQHHYPPPVCVWQHDTFAVALLSDRR